MSERPTRSDKPHSRLTELAAEMTKVLDLPENDDVKAVVMLQDGGTGGIQIHGYDDDQEALVDMFIHLRAIFESNGKSLVLIPATGLGGLS